MSGGGLASGGGVEAGETAAGGASQVFAGAFSVPSDTPGGVSAFRQGCCNCAHWLTRDLSRAVVLADFDGPAGAAIRALKFGGLRRLGPFLGQLVGRCLAADLEDLELLVPVPLHPARRRERGFNQAEGIAAGIGAVLGIPVAPRLLRRVRPTRQQARLSGAARLANVHQAFRLAGALPKGVSRIGLVDDVLTTGATLAACAGAVRQGAGVACGRVEAEGVVAVEGRGAGPRADAAAQARRGGDGGAAGGGVDPALADAPKAVTGRLGAGTGAGRVDPARLEGEGLPGGRGRVGPGERGSDGSAVPRRGDGSSLLASAGSGARVCWALRGRQDDSPWKVAGSSSTGGLRGHEEGPAEGPVPRDLEIRGVAVASPFGRASGALRADGAGGSGAPGGVLR